MNSNEINIMKKIDYAKIQSAETKYIRDEIV